MNNPNKMLLAFNSIAETESTTDNNDMPNSQAFQQMWDAAGSTLNNILLSIGILPNHSGYRYLKQAVLNVLFGNEECAYKLYILIGKATNSSPASIERAIRHSVNHAYNSGRLKAINKLFSANLVENYHLTNTEIIALLAQYLMDKKPWQN